MQRGLQNRIQILQEYVVILAFVVLFFMISYIITTAVYADRIDDNEEFLQCEFDFQCQSSMTIPCVENFCNLTTNTCQSVIPSSGECWSNAQCSNSSLPICDIDTCGCVDLCSNVTCISDDPCEIQRCDTFSGECVFSGFEPNCCSNTTTCPEINQCILGTCDLMNNECSYVTIDGAECAFDTDCTAPNSLCVDCLCSIAEEEVFQCNVQDQVILYDQIQASPVMEDYFGNCGFSVAVFGNISARVCTMFSGGIGGKLQISVFDGRDWVDTASFTDTANNWLNSRVDIYEDHILLGIPFAFDPIAMANIGTSLVFQYNHENETLTELQRFSFDDNPDFSFLRLGFAFDVAITENYIAIDGVIFNIAGVFTSLIYTYNLTGPNTWTFQEGLSSPFDPILPGSIVQSISLEDDLLVFGVQNSLNNSVVAAFIFNGNNWELSFRFPEDGNSDGINFGFRVSTDGESIAASTQPDLANSVPPRVYVFDRVGNVFANFSRPELTPSVVSDGFGQSLSIQGEALIVGCTQCDGITADSGAIYLYLRNEELGIDIWDFSRKGYPFDNPALAGNIFGESVHLSEDGILVVGSPNFDPTGILTPTIGASYIMECA